MSAETIHAVRNVGAGTAAELATYVVETGSRSSFSPNECERSAAWLGACRALIAVT